MLHHISLNITTLGELPSTRLVCINIKTLYQNAARMSKKLKPCKMIDGTYLKELGKILKVELLILDDFGLQSLDNHAREALMDIVDDRYGKSSTII